MTATPLPATATATVAATALTPRDYAGAVSRLAAYVVDLVALSALLAGGSAVVAFLVAVVTGHELGLADDRDVAGAGLGVWWIAYFAGSWAVTGRTLGMTLFGLRVVRPDGTAASPVSSLVRALAFPLSAALFGLGFLGILFDARCRALHDLIAGTAVIYRPIMPQSPRSDEPEARAAG